MVRHRLVGGAWIALPPVIVTLALAAFAVAELAGAHPLTPGPPRNAAEAAAMRDYGALLRFEAQPAAAAEIAMIRKGVLDDRVWFATPAEAAVLAHDRGALDLLAARGAQPDVERARLSCLARDIHDAALAASLDPAATCESGRALARVRRRP